jgi:ribosomal protein L22
MRVLLLRKKLVEYAPAVREHGLTLYHGTNLLNLYEILKSGRLGSEVGRHGGVYERLGRFYVTLDADEAWRYADEASRDITYFLPEDDVLFLVGDEDEEEALSTWAGISPEELKREIAGMDLRDQYVLLASLMFYLYGYDTYLPVVIVLTVKAPHLIENIYFDEDDVRDWLRRKECQDAKEFERIIEVAKRDPDFSQWLQPAEDEEVKDPIEVAAKEVEDQFLETFRDAMEVSDSDVYEAAFHLLARKIYLALINLAAQGDEEAKEILRQSKDRVESFFFRDYVQLSDVDEAVALVRLPNGTIQQIDLKSGNALEAVQKIMEKQIAAWIRKLTTASTNARIY